MGSNEENDDGLGGRGRQRRAFAAENQWAAGLLALDAVQLAAAPVTEAIREAVRIRHTMAPSDARNRQTQYIDKLCSQLDDDEKQAVRDYVQDPTVAYAELDQWVDRLLDDGDTAVEDWIDEHPATERQPLRNLVRNARKGGADKRKALRDFLVEQISET